MSLQEGDIMYWDYDNGDQPVTMPGPTDEQYFLSADSPDHGDFLARFSDEKQLTSGLRSHEVEPEKEELKTLTEPKQAPPDRVFNVHKVRTSNRNKEKVDYCEETNIVHEENVEQPMVSTKTADDATKAQDSSTQETTDENVNPELARVDQAAKRNNRAMFGAMAIALKKCCKGFTFNRTQEFLRRLIWESYPKLSEEDDDSYRALGQLLYLVYKNRLEDLVEDSGLDVGAKELII